MFVLSEEASRLSQPRTATDEDRQENGESEQAMKIGILGSGQVATALADGFLAHGHQAMLGTRDPDKLQAWLSKNPHGAVGSFAEAAKFGDVIVLAVKGTAAAEALAAGGEANLAGKTII